MITGFPSSHSHTDVAYKFEDLLQPLDDREGDTSDATLTYEQEDSELTVDYEQEDSVKEETKTDKEEMKIHTELEETKKEVESKKRKLEDSSDPPPGAKRTLSCAKRETAVAVAEGHKGHEGQGTDQGQESKETVDGGGASVGVVKSAGAATKPSLAKKDSMEENLICQICQVWELWNNS